MTEHRQLIRLGYVPPRNAREAAYNKGVDDAEAVFRERIAKIEALAKMMSDAGNFESHERRTQLLGYADGAAAAARIARGEA